MKAITILQPWASLIACGAKRIETRSWSTSHRGPLAIHAGRTVPIMDLFTPRVEAALWNEDTPFGKVIAIAELVDCVEMTIERIAEWRDMYGDDEIAFGHFEPGRYAWILANVRRIEPVLAKGRQRLWEWDKARFDGR